MAGTHMRAMVCNVGISDLINSFINKMKRILRDLGWFTSVPAGPAQRAAGQASAGAAAAGTLVGLYWYIAVILSVFCWYFFATVFFFKNCPAKIIN